MNDKIAHAVIGVFTVLYLAGAQWVLSRYGVGAAAAYGTTLMGLGVEVYQRVRKEGVPDIKDALATAAPGYLYWAAQTQL